MGFKSTILKWQMYSRMSELGIIARRKFFNNCFDGALTCAGIVSGAFVLFLFGGGNNSPNTIVILGFSTALAIGISGLWGAFLSEEAERKKKIIDLKREMVILEQKESEVTNAIEKEKLEIAKKIVAEKLIEKAMVIPIKNIDEKRNNSALIPTKTKSKKGKNNKTVVEQAEKFATIVASLVDGGAPALGSTLPLIPFFFGLSLNIFHFVFSYIILVGLLIYLGVFLGNISGQGRIKYALHLVTAGVVTLLVSLMLSLATGNI
ncbi:MAG: VIT1/CCC1 transporter family protein [Candidatus Hermodarchaeota archaeon]